MPHLTIYKNKAGRQCRPALFSSIRTASGYRVKKLPGDLPLPIGNRLGLLFLLRLLLLLRLRSLFLLSRFRLTGLGSLFAGTAGLGLFGGIDLTRLLRLHRLRRAYPGIHCADCHDSLLFSKFATLERCRPTHTATLISVPVVSPCVLTTGCGAAASACVVLWVRACD